MKIWGIADTHLADDKANSMGYWGPVWLKHREQIVENWRSVVDRDDLVLIGGDITWSTCLKHAMPDIEMISRLPGKFKIMVKGNHDMWWSEYEELCRAVPESIKPLSGNAIKIDDQVICGTMGWVAPNDPFFESLDMPAFKRESILLRQTLDSAMALNPTNGIHLLTHYPPFTSKGLNTDFIDIIADYDVATCTFGHFHIQAEWDCIPQGNINGTEYRLTSTDYLEHKPYLIWES